MSHRFHTRLGLAVMDYFRAKASTGSVVAFGPLFEAMQAAGDIPKGNYETVRKPLQRTLNGASCICGRPVELHGP